MEEFEIGQRVLLPLNETGTIVKKTNIPWGFDHIVRIRKGVFNKTNQRIGFKKEQLIKEDNK